MYRSVDQLGSEKEKRADRVADGPNAEASGESGVVGSNSTHASWLRSELAEKAGHLRRMREEVVGLECRILLCECVASAELLCSTLAGIAQRADEQGMSTPDWGKNRIQNCRRAIESALLWAGEYGQ